MISSLTKRLLPAAFLALVVATSLSGSSDAAAKDPLILAAGDISCASSTISLTTCHAKATSDLITWQYPAAVLTLGDNQYESGTLAAYNTYFSQNWGRFKPQIRPSAGNHEYGTSGAAGYFDYFGEAAGPRSLGYYSYDIGAWHIVVLNSNISRGATSAQVSWLKRDLADHPAACTLAYWHHPRWSSGEHGNNTSVGTFWNALYAARADVVLNGHDHIYERFAPQNPNGVADWNRGIREFVVGTGGKSQYSLVTLRPNSQVRNTTVYGVLRLVLHRDSYDWRFLPESGQLWTDYGSRICT
jgi:calcineurin-like phosphoesterase family protein